MMKNINFSYQKKKKKKEYKFYAEIYVIVQAFCFLEKEKGE